MKKDIDKEVEICDCCEVHENLLQIVNETIPEENELKSDRSHVVL